MARNFTPDDEGKRVVTADGDVVGTVDTAAGSSAHVRADENISQSMRRRLGWTEEHQDTFELDQSTIDRITDDEIRLKDTL